MPNLLSQLTKDEQSRLLDELNYLNLGEIRGFCSERSIPYKILSHRSQAQARRERVEEPAQSQSAVGPANAGKSRPALLRPVVAPVERPITVHHSKSLLAAFLNHPLLKVGANFRDLQTKDGLPYSLGVSSALIRRPRSA